MDERFEDFVLRLNGDKPVTFHLGEHSFTVRRAAAAQGGAYVENPAEIEHVAGDVSKNRSESNMKGVAYAELPDELVRLADIMRDCGRLISKSGDGERILRAAAAALRASHGQAPAAQQPSPAVVGIPGNFITHRAAWRKALETARAQATGDDVSYWEHELQAFDRSFDRLWALMQPAPTAQPAPAATPQAASQPEDENDAHNFDICQCFDHWLLEQGAMLTPHSEESDGPMAPALNWIASVEAMVATRAPADNVTAPAAQGDALIEALEIGLECAQQVAAEYHEAYKGHRPDTHAALDADVEKIKTALAAARTGAKP